MHTPRPWNFVISSHQREWHGWIEKEDGDTIAAIANLEEAEANARLFVTVPELLETCADLLNACDKQMAEAGAIGNLVTAMEQARTIIAKAVW